MATSIAKWKKEIRKTESSLTREDIMTSRQFAEISQAAVDAMTVGCGRVQNENKYLPDDDMTAYSAGGYVVINTAMRVIENEPDHAKAMLLVAGLRAHECGHELWTDADEWKKYYTELNKTPENIFSGNETLWHFDNEKEGKEFVNDMIAHKTKRRVITNLAHEIMNAYEDAFVNNGVYQFFSGEPKFALKVLNDRAFSSRDSIEQSIKNVVEGKMDEISFLMNYLHLEAIGYPIKSDGSKLDEDEQCCKDFMFAIIESLKDVREKLPWITNTQERMNLVTKVVLVFYHLIEAMISPPPMPSADENGEDGESKGSKSKTEKGGSKSGTCGTEDGTSDSEEETNENDDESSDADNEDSKSGSSKSKSGSDESCDSDAGEENKNSGSDADSGDSEQNDSSSTESGNSSGSGSSDLTEELAEKILNNLEQMIGTTEEKKSGNAKMDLSEIDKLDEEQVKKVIDKITEKLEEKIHEAEKKYNAEKDAIIENETITRCENQHETELRNEADEINKTVASKKRSISIRLERPYVTDSGKSIAQSIAKTVEKDAYFLARKLKTILKDREVEDFERRKFSGNKVFVKDAAKPGNAVFARRNEPTGKPNIRICILVDESGSMSCGFSRTEARWEAARRMSIMLHKVLKDVNVSHCIVGHTTYNFDELTLNNYVDFDTVDSNDIYRLAFISPNSGNMDGAAITQCCEKLLKYPEKKLLIVISDGLPTKPGYFDSNAKKDTEIAVSNYTKKGVEIFAARLGIGEHEEQNYRNIYGNKVLDCSTPEKFSNELIRLIQKYVLAK